MQIFDREIYLKQVKPFISKNLIKVITGQRRSGKSYFLKQIISFIKTEFPEKQIIYINKEDFEFDIIKDYSSLVKYVEEQKSKKLVALFIDEIQEVTQFEKALRHFLTKEHYDIYCTGSNANLLSGDLATLLSGRSIEIEIFPLCYTEFLQFHNLKNTNESFDKFMVFGGMPNLIHLPLEDEIVFNYLKNVYNTIVVRDVIEKYNVRNSVFLRNLSLYLSDNVGSLVSAKKISDYLKSQQIKISPNLVIEYISYLCNAFFIHQVKRSDLQGKKIFEINEKYYFNDIGLRNSLVGYKSTDINKILENIVYNHLKIKGYSITVGQDRNKEIDFVAKKNNEIIYIQVCYLLESKQTIEREFGNLQKIKNDYSKYVISMDKTSKATYKGIKHMHIKDFCSLKVDN
ncbi:MAG: ATP-binding protein [Bacteroidota bacterium]|nr:ATP-binding protein [Bacteroidota bacterium]